MESTHLNGSTTLQAKLNEPQTVAALTRLLDRIDSLEHTVNALVSLTEQGPGMAAMMGDIADETVRQAAARGVNIEERLKAALTIAEKLTAPEMVAKLDQLLALAEQAPMMAAMVGDMVDDMAARLDVQARLNASLSLADKATQPETLTQLSEMFEVLLEAETSMLNPDAVRTVGLMAQAMVAARQAPPTRVGLLGMLRALGDPDIQRAMGFLMEMGKQFSKELD